MNIFRVPLVLENIPLDKIRPFNEVFTEFFLLFDNLRRDSGVSCFQFAFVFYDLRHCCDISHSTQQNLNLLDVAFEPRVFFKLCANFFDTFTHHAVFFRRINPFLKGSLAGNKPHNLRLDVAYALFIRLWVFKFRCRTLSFWRSRHIGFFTLKILFYAHIFYVNPIWNS